MLQRKRKIHKKDPCNLIGEAINLYLTILNLVDLKSYEKEIIKNDNFLQIKIFGKDNKDYKK